MTRLVIILSLLCLCSVVQCARILVFVTVASISHQLPFRRLSQELARRGHDVVVITTDPAFEKGKAPPNLTEIDLHDLSYDAYKAFLDVETGKLSDLRNEVRTSGRLMVEVLVKQLQTPEAKNLLYNGKFDLLIIEAMARSTLIFSHFHKVPVIQMSSLGGWFTSFEMMGAMTHPTLYPFASRQRLNNVTMWEKIEQLYKFYCMSKDYEALEQYENELLRKHFDPNMPSISELHKNVDMLFLNEYPLWDSNRPVGPNIVYVGGIHDIKPKELPKDFETYLNSSKNGVIYMSFGTNMNPSTLPPSKIQMIVKVFSLLPYDVLWKWDKDELPGRTENIRIGKWFPQPDLLRHPKVKLFITQGGLQSTDEALTAGVPVICIPMLGDQWYNCEKYATLGMGKNLLMENLEEGVFKSVIEEVAGDPSYRERVVQARILMRDQPQSALDRAVWWTEHLLRHGGGKHLRPPGAGISWREFLELDLVLVVLSVVLVSIATVIGILYYLIRILMPKKIVKKAKRN